jgi:hypothetical protein
LILGDDDRCSDPEFDKALRAVFSNGPDRRPMPGADLPEADLSVPTKDAMSPR